MSKKKIITGFVGVLIAVVVLSSFSLSPNGKGVASAADVVTIPVVFHVLYNLPEQNISDAQINSQIDALNENFNAENPDVSTVPVPFMSLVGRSGIRFVLAKRDPQGNPTNGIIRKYTTITSFSSDGAACFSSLGGDDAWPHDQYLNIWVVNKSGAAGYSAYPWSGSAATDGVIVGYNYVGKVGTFTNNWNYQKGRTVVHEVGHWLGLVHIWGDATCGSDLVADTPTHEKANGSCPAFPHVSMCAGSAPNGDMFMNYMDYTNDDCRTMFSQGQVDRMLGFLNTTRAGLLTSLGGVAPSGSDITPPIISSVAASNITTSGATITFSTDEPSDTQMLYGMASGNYTTTVPTNSTPVTSHSIVLSGLTAGTKYYYVVKSKDMAGNVAVSSEYSFTTVSLNDTTAPATTFSAATGTWTNTSVLRTLTCIDSGSGCKITYWTFVVNGSACPAATLSGTGYTTGTTATWSTQGQWRLCAYSIDNVNNVENPKFTEPFNIDTKPPTTAVNAPANNSTVSGKTVALTVAAADALSGVKTIQITVDGVNVGAPGTSSPYTVYWDSTTASNATHIVSLKATDVAGNTNSIGASASVTVSNASSAIPPVVTITSPTGSTIPTKGNTTLSFTATATTTNSSISYIQLSINNSLQKTCPNVTTCTYTWRTKDILPGSYTLKAVAVDAKNVAGQATKVLTK